VESNQNVESKIPFLLQEIRKISKIVAITLNILRLKCTKIQFPLELRPIPLFWEAYIATPDLLAVFKGAYLLGDGRDGSVMESKEIIKIDPD